MLQEIIDQWTRLAGEFKHAVDANTVRTVVKIEPGASESAINELFISTDDRQRIFDSLNAEDTKIVCGRLVRMIADEEIKVRSLADIKPEANSLWTFSGIVDHVHMWICEDAFAGMRGGSSIKDRAQADANLRRDLGSPGFAAVMLYCLVHWRELNETGEQHKPGKESGQLYPGRFRHQIWYDLAATVFFRWNMDCVLEDCDYKRDLKKIGSFIARVIYFQYLLTC